MPLVHVSANIVADSEIDHTSPGAGAGAMLALAASLLASSMMTAGQRLPLAAALTSDSSLAATARRHTQAAASLSSNSSMTAGGLDTHEVAASLHADSGFTSTATVHYHAAAALAGNSALSTRIMMTAALAANSHVTADLTVLTEMAASVAAGSIFFINPALVNIFHTAAPTPPPAKFKVPPVVPIRFAPPEGGGVHYSLSGSPKPPPRGFPR